MTARASGPSRRASAGGEAEITQGTLLAGRVRYAQPCDGYRSGLEPVLLAAAIPAFPNQRVLEGGAGAGAGLLCLAARVPGLAGVGVEFNPALCALARENAAANGFSGLEFRAADIGGWSDPDRFDHAFANPPWHPPEGTCSPSAGRAGAKRASPGLLEIWIGALAGCLRRGGTLTLILPASAVPACLRAMEDTGCGGTVLFPLWPGRDRPAKIVLVQSKRTSRAPFRVCSGLVLHGPSGDFTDEANAVLRGGAALAF